MSRPLVTRLVVIGVATTIVLGMSACDYDWTVPTAAPGGGNGAMSTTAGVGGMAGAPSAGGFGGGPLGGLGGEGGGGGIVDPCAPDAGDTACILCVKGACCMQYTACLDDPNCVCWLGCSSDPNVCLNMCGAPGPAATAIAACAFNSCSMVCQLPF